MSLSDRLLSTITGRTRAVIAVFIVLTLVFGTGMALVEEDTSLEQFETDTREAEKLEYIQDNFGDVDEETTTAQIVIREENALDRKSLIETLELQQEFRANETINETLVDDRSDEVEHRRQCLDRADELER